MSGNNRRFWDLGGRDPAVVLLGLGDDSSGRRNSIEQLVDFLSSNVVFLEDGLKNSSSSKREGLFNFLFLFPRLNGKLGEEGEDLENVSRFPFDFKLVDSILEEKALLEDLVILLGSGDYDVFRRLYDLLIKFTPLDLKELLGIEKVRGSMVCIYFTMYLSILLKVSNYECLGHLNREREVEQKHLSWINMFISQMGDLLGYFNGREAVGMSASDINNDCLLLVCALLLYLIFSVLIIDEERRAEFKSLAIGLIRIQPGDIRLDYWYLKILLVIIEGVEADLSVSELVLIILRYQRFMGVEQPAGRASVCDWERSMNRLGTFEVHVMTQLCREWVVREVTLKRQLMRLVDKFVSTHQGLRGLESSASKTEEVRLTLGSEDHVFLGLISLFCRGFGVSIKGSVQGCMSQLISDQLEIDSLVLLDLLSELLQGRNSQKISSAALFDSIRMLVAVLTILADPGNFENENYNIKDDIVQNDLVITNVHKRGWNLKACKCVDLIEKLFTIITGLIIRHKSMEKELSGSTCTISSVSSSSTSSAFKTTTFDISLFLLVWNNYVTLMTNKEGRGYREMLNRSIQLVYLHLINRKYKLDVLCEITFSVSESDGGLPVLLDERYSGLIGPWICLWRNYLDENPDLFYKKVDELEKIFTVPNIGYFFDYLEILDRTVQDAETPTLSSGSSDRECKSIPKISNKVLELTGIVSSILVSHKISHVSGRHNTLMAILSASENPRVMYDYIYKQVANSLQLDGVYIYNCLKFFRERWSSSIKIRVFSLISDLYISQMKQSLFQFIQCLLGNLSVRGGIFEKSFALFKIRGMRGIISDEDFEILQQKLTDVSLRSSLGMGDGSASSMIKNEVFFGCYSIDLYYTINNIQKGWQSPTLSISPSSPKTFLNKKRHSSLVITDSEDVYSIISRLNPLFDQLSNDEDYLKIFMGIVGEISRCYFHFLFGDKEGGAREERRLVEQVSNLSVVFGVKFEDDEFMASMNMEHELLKNVRGQAEAEEEVIKERFNYKFYSQLIIRMIYLCTWMVVDNINESYRSLSEIFVDKVLSGLFGMRCCGEQEEGGLSPCRGDGGGDSLRRFDSSLPDYYVMEHYTKFVCIVWSMLSSMNPDSIFKSYTRVLGRSCYSYYQLYVLLVFLLESSDWMKYHGYFQYVDLLRLSRQVELMASLSSACSHASSQEGEKASCGGGSSALSLKILLVCLILKSVTVERSGEALESYKKKHSTTSRGGVNQEQELSQIKINTFNNKWVQRDAYVNGGKSMVNASYFLSCRVLPYLWSFYESYPTYKDVYTRLLQTSTQLTTYLDGLCVDLYDSKTWQGIMSNFNNVSSESLVDIFDNRLLSYNQYIVLEYIWEYYINGNTMLLVEKYISALTFSVYSLKKAGFFEVWLLLSFWKRYPTRIYRHMMKVNSTWIVPFLMDHLIHYSILVRSRSIGVSSRRDLIHAFENVEFENTLSFLLYHYHPQHYHERMSGKYFWYIVNSEQGYLNKINSHSTETKGLTVNCRYIHGGGGVGCLSVFQFHDYLHYIGHSLPLAVVIYLLSNQFSSEKKKFISNSHHFHNYFHHSMYASTLIVWSCVRSLLRFQESEWELLLLQYMEIIKSSKKNNHLVLACLLDMALKSTRFSQILCIYTNNPNSPIMKIFQKCIFKECDSLLAFESREEERPLRLGSKQAGRDGEGGRGRRAIGEEEEKEVSRTNDKSVINRLRTVQDSMEDLTLRMSSASSLISRYLDGASGVPGGSLNCSDRNMSQMENKQHSLANVQFSFFYILCQLGEMAKYRDRREGGGEGGGGSDGYGLPLEEDGGGDYSALVGRLNSKEITQLKSEIAQNLLTKIENVIQRREYRNVPFLNTNMLKSSQEKTRLLSIKKINRLKILQSAKNIPYLLSLQLTNQSPEGRETGEDKGDGDAYELTVNLIVKCNDDCRQDVITMQYIHVFQKIFEMYNIPVWLYPYRILPMMFKDINNSVVYGGIIEFIEDSISLHEIHELHPEGGLKAYYESTFRGGKDSRGRGRTSYEQARYNFISSLAGYSIACYVLQIKDRHNGNILVTKDGHIIHIDYGFIFDISPGNNLHFERAAFKVTQEMLDFMDDQVDLFDDLCLSGFLAVREHADLLLSLTQMLLNSGIPCFRGETIKKLKERLLLNFSQQQASNIFSKKIHSAHNHITTKGYDLVQFIQQGIK